MTSLKYEALSNLGAFWKAYPVIVADGLLK